MCEKKKKRRKTVTVRRVVVGECWPPGKIGEVPKSWVMDIDLDSKRSQ